ncbi:hypothetical protein DFQ09_1312 [Winogradskyella pacifica]|uniref:Uncharacterized protein n=1 Tax=Winogradskyella pacifica TaxID=664642 RepID=A0A3D9LJH2_9FLAO|nr:hypothetical protein [Winogradskyella pacifica]REE06920.1 hypothetical protein DFQ09_1312 [Winogradskyella pacifica]
MKQTIHFFYRFLSLPILLIIISSLIGSLLTVVHKEKDSNIFIFLSIICLVIVGWLIFMIYELIRFHKKKSIGLRNINIAVLFTYTLLIYGIYYLFFAQYLIYSEKSPDNNYKLEVYEESRLKLFSIAGDGSSRIIHLKLYDKNEKLIKESYKDCLTWGFENKVYWKLESQLVSFSSECFLSIPKKNKQK